jgi:WD40 repeat protein
VVALDRDRALSASWDHTLRLWDLATGTTLRILDGHSRGVTHMVALDRDRALSASRNNTLHLWDLATGAPLRVLEGHSDSVTHVVALDRDRALSASRDNTLRLWDLTSGRVVSLIPADDGVTAIAVASNSPLGVAGLASGKVFSFRF